MKKIMIIIAAAIIALCAFAGCGGTKTAEDLKAFNVRKEYYLGDEFEQSAITAKLLYSDGSQRDISSDGLTIDFSDFNCWQVGVYTINVTEKETLLKTQLEVEVVSVKEDFQWYKDRTLKVLIIGNSYTDDTMEYAASVAIDLGYKVKFGTLHYGGSDLDMHYEFATKDQKVYDYRINDSGVQVTNGRSTVREAVLAEDWDIIGFQQASILSGNPASYSKLNDVVDFVSKLTTNPDVKFIWDMTWAYDGEWLFGEDKVYKNQADMYSRITSTAKQIIIPNERFNMLTPIGTAIQNARSSKDKPDMSRDGTHLSYDFGRYVAGLTLACAVTGRSASEVKFAPIGLTALQRSVAKESVDNALANPFEVTPSEL